MQLSDFHYELPKELIALYPKPERSASRLMHLDGASGQLQHLTFSDFPELLDERDLLVFNNTKVMPARLFGRKETGGKVELLIERILNATDAICQIRASKSPKPGARLYVSEYQWLEVTGRESDFYNVHFDGDLYALLEQHGHMPLPPYIERDDEQFDRERYQTVFAKTPGAVAAPTAGLHFDETLLKRIEQKGVDSTYVTLHVGAGTFQPVRVDNIEEHHMHSEHIDVDQTVCEKILAARERGGRVIAVGTTCTRSLESAAMFAEDSGRLIAPYQGDTDIFIYPGYRFRCVDAMITNFHLPESTLLMLVSAFAGRDQVLNAYQEAIRNRYRFFSYGDAMFMTKGHF